MRAAIVVSAALTLSACEVFRWLAGSPQWVSVPIEQHRVDERSEARVWPREAVIVNTRDGASGLYKVQSIDETGMVIVDDQSARRLEYRDIEALFAKRHVLTDYDVPPSL